MDATDPRHPATLGQHLKKHRLERRLRQVDVARQIRVHPDTVANWEAGATTPVVRLLPRIFEFLGFVPLPPPASLPERLRHYRATRGLTQRQLARQLRVDPATVARWETGRLPGSIAAREQIERLLAGLPRDGPTTGHESS